MNTTILNYPGFQTLPKGIKQMLLASETHFFGQPMSHHNEQKRPNPPLRTGHGLKFFFASYLASPA